MKLVPTEEQKNIIDLAMEGEDIVINAFAGASKSTTLVMIANEKHQLGGEVGMYLAFNKAIAVEAEGKFPNSVDCRTVHSLAYGKTPKALRDKLKLDRVFPKDLAKLYGFAAQFIVSVDGSDLRKFISVNSKMSMVNQTVTRFCSSADDEITDKHVVLVDWMNKINDNSFNFTDLRKEILELSKTHWNATIDPESAVPMTHDAYLKLYSMNVKQIPVSYIMVDESQDSSPVIMNIINKQKKAQKIYVGDRYQAIYGWRGAINAMEIAEGEVMNLTKSFRFGQNVEKLARILLKKAGCEVELSGNGCTEGKVYLKERSIQPNAVICRTNAGVIKNIFEYSSLYPDKTIGASCDTGEIEKFVRAFESLMLGKRVEHPLLSAFENITELMEYCDDNPEDLEIVSLVKIIDKFGVKAVLASMARCTNTKKPDILITTAHKSKGLEWDNVTIYSDFSYDAETRQIEREELNILYVAITRAKKNICIAGIHDILNGLSKDQGIVLDLEDASPEYLDHLNRVLEFAKAKSIKFYSRGASMNDVEAFCSANEHLLTFDLDNSDGGLIDSLQGV